MLKDLNINQSYMDLIVESLNVVQVKTDKYYIGKSNIQGQGVFASKNINKGDVVGLGSIDCLNKTFLGRYTNHSDTNNAMFYYLLNNDVVMVAEVDIKKNEEILINYKDHVLKKEYLYEKRL